MLTMAFFKKLWQRLRFVFVFRCPAFTELNCIDIVIDNKPLFLLTWQLRRGYYVKLRPTGRRFQFSTGAAVIKLPPSADAVTIIAGNLWRKRKEKVLLSHYQLNDAAAAEIIQRLRPFDTMETKIPAGRVRKVMATTRQVINMNRRGITMKVPKAYCSLSITLNKASLQFPNP
jgi:hypothetical protein